MWLRRLEMYFGDVARLFGWLRQDEYAELLEAERMVLRDMIQRLGCKLNPVTPLLLRGHTTAPRIYDSAALAAVLTRLRRLGNTELASLVEDVQKWGMRNAKPWKVGRARKGEYLYVFRRDVGELGWADSRSAALRRPREGIAVRSDRVALRASETPALALYREGRTA